MGAGLVDEFGPSARLALYRGEDEGQRQPQLCCEVAITRAACVPGRECIQLAL